MTLINAIIAFYLQSRSSNRSRLIPSCSTIRQQPLLCTVPSQAWTQLHTHQRSICAGDSECVLRPVPASASVSMESLHLALIVMADLSLLIFCAHSTKAPPTPVTTHDASVCPLVALASTPHLFHSRWSKTLQQLMLPKTPPCDCDNCSLALATEICLSPPVCI